MGWMKEKVGCFVFVGLKFLGLESIRWITNPRSEMYATTCKFPGGRPAPVTTSLLQNRVLRGLGNAEFDDGLSRDPDLLLRSGVETRPRLPLLFYQLPEAGQDEFAVLFDQ